MKKLKSIKKIEMEPIYDISVKDAHHFILQNGAVFHNSMFGKTTMTGGQKATLAADTIFFMGRRQQKEGTEVTGYDFVLNVEKSRYVKEKSKFIIEARWDTGVNPFSGLFDVAKDSEWIISPSKGYYQIVNKDTGEILFDGKKFREREIRDSKEIWFNLLKTDGFRKHLRDEYQIQATEQTTPEEDVDEFNSIVGIR